MCSYACLSVPEFDPVGIGVQAQGLAHAVGRDGVVIAVEVE